MTRTTFFVPDFSKNIPNKVGRNLEVKSKNTLSSRNYGFLPAIAVNGFPSKKDGVYVYVTKIDDNRDRGLYVGFTDMRTYDSTIYGTPGDEISGTSLNCGSGNRLPGPVEYLPYASKAKREVISILIISNKGTKKEVQWILDGTEGPVQDCTKCLGNGDEIFPCISFASQGQQVTTIPFDQVKSRSPKIDQLMQEFINNKNRNQSSTIN